MGGPDSVQPTSTPVADTGFLALRLQFIAHYADGTVQHVDTSAVHHPIAPTAHNAFTVGRYDVDAARLRTDPVGTNASDAIDGRTATDSYSAFPNRPNTTTNLDRCR